MLNTKALQKLNSSALLRSLHHPDPLTRQQTQRFLDAVTASFRRNLDQEHGWPTLEDKSSSSASIEPKRHLQATPATEAAHDAAEPAARGVRRRPTDHHLSSILSSPLFGPTPSIQTRPGAKRDPMDVFDEAVYKGLMTIPIATGCLKAKRKIIKDSRSALLDDQAPQSRSHLSNFGISDRVLGWLRSSGMGSNLSFAYHPGFMTALIPFLVAEGKDVVVWGWIKRLMSAAETQREGSIAAAREVLYLLVNSQTSDLECVSGAFESVIQASETYREDPRHDKLLTRAWRNVAWRAASPSWHKATPTVSLFDAYLAVADYLDPPRTKLPVAHLHLYHPSTPTHDRALEYFEQMKKGEDSGTTEPIRKEAIMGVDAVSHLGLIGELEEAKSLMSFIQRKYSSFFDTAGSITGDELLGQLESAG